MIRLKQIVAILCVISGPVFSCECSDYIAFPFISAFMVLAGVALVGIWTLDLMKGNKYDKGNGLLKMREKTTLAEEKGWIDRQGLEVYVDLSTGINLYPDLRLIDNIEEEYDRSTSAILDVMDKMTMLSSKHLVISLHRFPENNFTKEQTWESFYRTVKLLASEAMDRDIVLYIRLTSDTPPANPKEARAFLDNIAAENLLAAPCISSLIADGTTGGEVLKHLNGKIGMWVIAAPEKDAFDTVWNLHAPIYRYKNQTAWVSFINVAADVPFVFDGNYRDMDEEYLDVRLLEKRRKK